MDAIDFTILMPAMREAGRLILEVKARGVQARYKADDSPVTEADEAANAVLCAALAEHYPQIPIISEEHTASHSLTPSSGYFLVDPLDGTREFLRPDSNGHFTVNIGFIQDGKACGGIIFAPATNWLCWTNIEGLAYQEHAGNQTALQIRTTPLSGAVALASRSHLDPRTKAFLEAENITDIVSAGSSLKFLFLAAGKADIYPRFGPTMEWDTAAGEAILRAAGGQVLDPAGQPYRYGKPGWKNGPFIACAGYSPHFPLPL